MTLSPAALTRLKSMSKTGDCWIGLPDQIEPELSRLGLVQAKARHREGVAWELTAKAVELIKNMGEQTNGE